MKTQISPKLISYCFSAYPLVSQKCGGNIREPEGCNLNCDKDCDCSRHKRDKKAYNFGVSLIFVFGLHADLAQFNENKTENVYFLKIKEKR